jgi:hypothetical protein
MNMRKHTNLTRVLLVAALLFGAVPAMASQGHPESALLPGAGLAILFIAGAAFTGFGGPDDRTVQPDPVMSRVMVDSSKQGGWLAPQLCGIQTVAKDYVRFFKEDAQALLSALDKTVRLPGMRANLIEAAKGTWDVASIVEDAVRSEYTMEQVNNSPSPERPRMLAARRVLNVLQAAFELRVATLLDPDAMTLTFATQGTTWAGASTKILSDIDKAAYTMSEACGLEPNYIRIPRKKWGGVVTSDEIAKNNANAGLYLALQQEIQNSPSGFPRTFAGLRLLIGTARRDTAPTGSFTPAFFWDSTALKLNNTVHIGYSPVLDGGEWDGEQQTYLGAFENSINGAPFDPQEYPDPYFQENGKMIVHSRFRRSAPKVFNANCCVAITGI